MSFSESYYSLESLIFQSICSICQTRNPDFFKSPTEFFHLTCYLNIYKDPQRTSSYIPSSFRKPDFFCSTCKTEKDIYSCQDCRKIFCIICAFSKPTRICCPAFQDLLSKTLKKCEGCEYLKTVQNFCLSNKCEAHDFLCQKCFDLGQASLSCVFGCEMVKSCETLVSCVVCGSLRMRYQGEVSCLDGCEVCEICFYESYVNNLDDCPGCHKPLLIKN